MANHRAKRSRVATYDKSPKSQKYDRCPSCRSTKAVNYIKQMQRNMRCFCCARCTVTFFTWGPKILKPRTLRDMHGRKFLYQVDEMGEGND